ncbi:MAG: hypothetical protein FRX49_05906 [Trebouxia sp. A1-2]|nr:MAG: hypothetical protein FRX49_05906 [Trebouxia sp. A1-2]
MTRASRKRKLETIVLSDSEEERTETSLSQSTALRQPLQFSQPTRPPSVPRDNTAQPTIRKTSLQQESKLLVGSRVPKSSADLAVPKKKVGEVRDWLLADHGPSLLLLSGPSGCGKTSTIRVLAAENGAEVTEWTTPTPTLWAEYVQQASLGHIAPSLMTLRTLFLMPSLVCCLCTQQMQQSLLNRKPRSTGLPRAPLRGTNNMTAGLYRVSNLIFLPRSYC